MEAIHVDDLGQFVDDACTPLLRYPSKERSRYSAGENSPRLLRSFK